jgi:hypothetical protein
MKLFSFIYLSILSASAIAHDPSQPVEWLPFVGVMIAVFLVGYSFCEWSKKNDVLRNHNHEFGTTGHQNNKKMSVR